MEKTAPPKAKTIDEVFSERLAAECSSGPSGLVCRDRSQLLDSIALLVDSQLLRRAFGHAARGRARHQAGRHRFRASLLLAHGLPGLGVH